MKNWILLHTLIQPDINAESIENRLVDAAEEGEGGVS